MQDEIRRKPVEGQEYGREKVKRKWKQVMEGGGWGLGERELERRVGRGKK